MYWDGMDILEDGWGRTKVWGGLFGLEISSFHQHFETVGWVMEIAFGR